MKIFEACLAKAVADGKIKQKTADDYKALYAGAAREAIQRGLGDPDVSVAGYNFAASEAAQRMMKKVGQNKQVVAQDIVRLQTRMNQGEDYRVSGKSNVFSALQTLLGERLRGKGEMPSLQEQYRTARALLGRQASDIIETLRSKNWGLTRDASSAWDMVREHYGHATGNPSAKVNYEAWKGLKDWHADRLEEEKIFINARVDHLLPQNYNSINVRTATKAGYVDSYLEQMRKGTVGLRDWKSSSAAYLDPNKPDDLARIREIMEGAWDNITTHGHASVEPGMPQGATLAERYSRRRVIDYLTLDGYRWFQETYGNGVRNLGDSFLREIDRMSHDLGTAWTLGGDPDKTARTMIDWGKNRGLTPNQVKKLEATYFHASGRAAEPANTSFANWMSAGRQMFASQQLHSAVLGSLPDFAFMRSTASWDGLDATRMMRFYISEAGDARQARQHAIIVDTGIRGLRDHFDENLGANLTNFKNGMSMPEKWEAASAGVNRLAGQAAEFVMRGTGLENHSNRGRVALGMEILATAADHAGKGFDVLNPRFRRMLERYGINAEDWDILRTDAMGGDNLFMQPGQLGWEGNARQRTAARKMLGMVDAETHYAIPEGGVTTRAWLLGKSEPGTPAGELLRAIQYKGFSLSVTMMHGTRMIEGLFDKSGAMPRGQYLMALAINATLLGALSYQLKNIVAGKDPESMLGGEFWIKAAAMGGAGGMLGDQVKTMMQTKSMDDIARMVSPTAGFLGNTMMLTTGNLFQRAEGTPTNFGRESASYLRKYLLPRLWYTNQAVDKLGFDTLQRMLDPGAAGAFARIEQRVYKESGTQFWWHPGQTEPSRAPNLKAAVQ